MQWYRTVSNCRCVFSVARLLRIVAGAVKSLSAYGKLVVLHQSSEVWLLKTVNS